MVTEICEEEDLPADQRIYFNTENVFNQRLLRVWSLCFNQVLFCGDYPSALDLNCLPFLFEAVDVPRPDWEDTIRDLKTISAGMLDAIWETKKEQQLRASRKR